MFADLSSNLFDTTDGVLGAIVEAFTTLVDNVLEQF